MAEKKAIRLSKAARELNVGISTIVEFLNKKGHDIEVNPNTKLEAGLYGLLIQEYSSDLDVKKKSEKFSMKNLRDKKESISLDDIVEENKTEAEDEPELLIKDNSASISKKEVEVKEEIIEKVIEPVVEETRKAPELKVVGKVDLEKFSAKKVVKKEQVVDEKPSEKLSETKAEIKPEVEPETKPETKPEPEPEKTVAEEVVVEKPTEEIKEVKEKVEKKEISQKPKETVVADETEKAKLEDEQKPPMEKSEDDKISGRVKKGIDLKVVGKVDLSLVDRKPKSAKKAKKEDFSKKTKKEEVTKEEVTKKDPKKEEKIETPLVDHAKKTPKEVVNVDKVETKIEVKQEPKPKAKEENEMIPTVYTKLSGPRVVGKIELPKPKPPTKRPIASSSNSDKAKKKRKRISKDTKRIDFKGKPGGQGQGPKRNVPSQGQGNKRKKKLHRPEVKEEDVQKQIKDTLAKLTSKGSKTKASKHRRDKRETVHQKMQAELEQQNAEKNVIKVTEFVSVSELSTLMNVPVNRVIQTCMTLGLFVSINQRLDAETLSLVADEFNYQVEFVSIDLQESLEHEEIDKPEDLLSRPPIVTVMGHVDHGKTKLLDHVRHANVIDGEAGGITQHIGAYSVKLTDGRKITFLDTPGHEAFTAMRARGAQVTDIAIIVVAADDGVKPQTIEAINHASAAGVPMVFAINKIDKSTANPEKIKQELASMNYLVEDWGGKYQSQDISAKNGIAIEELLEKVLLEAEMLDLKANPNKKASGTVVESSLDKGRGYISTILVETGTLSVGDVVLAGSNYGHVKAMYNERGEREDKVGPATPVLVLGLNGAPQAGDKFNVLESDKEAKDFATKREQLQREQELRTQKHITLDEIGRRIAIGNFKELNVIVKGDVDGSVEALSDSLLKLSTDEIQVNIKHKAVGQISESDILLAAASDAVIIGFQVRPSLSARKIAEREQIDIRLYSIIYDAIEDLKSAMEGMLSPEIREEVVATLEIIEVFKITKVGTIAGCMVKEGKIKRDSKVRIIRDGIVVYSGALGALKRFKDDAKEVVMGLECGLSIENFGNLKVGDAIEAYTETEIRKKL